MPGIRSLKIKTRIPGESRDPPIGRSGHGELSPGFLHGSAPRAEGLAETVGMRTAGFRTARAEFRAAHRGAASRPRTQYARPSQEFDPEIAGRRLG